VLVHDGRPVALERHLKRLCGSVLELYSTELPAGLEDELLAAAWGLDLARMRVEVTPTRHGVEARVETSALPARQVPVRLSPKTVPGGLGAHKWIDRRLLAALAADTDGEPLLCDLDGFVLESTRATVFAVEPGPVLVTPAADGRILPGVTRARVLRVARELGFDVRVEPVALGRLARADEVFVTGALGGVEPAQLEDRRNRSGAVTARLAEALLAAGHVSLSHA
jgi:para-aminobenzoate synthetase/4-amino-4-deoxychorismate lyase